MLKKTLNPFMIVLIIVSFAFAFRLSNIITASPDNAAVGISMPASAIEESKETPPPAEELKKVAPTLDAAGSDDKKNQDAQKSRGLPELPARTFSQSEIEVLQSLSKRRDELDRRERELDQRQALLDAAGQEIDRKVGELSSMRKKLEELLGQQQTAEDDRIKSLVKIYENMKPKEAAKIFDTLDIDVLMTVITKMSERKTSPILASMDPEKAKTVTIRLAEQRKLPGLPDESEKNTPAPAAVSPPAPAPAAVNPANPQPAAQ